MNALEDSLKKRYLIKLFSNLINGAVNILFIALIPKSLGPVAYGHFSYLQQFFSQLLGLFDAGTSMAFFTKLSSNQKRKELISFYALYMVVVFLLIFAIIYLIRYTPFMTILFPNIPQKYIFIGMGLGFLTWVSQIFIKISDAYALTVSVELLKILHKFASLGLLFYFIYYLTFDLSAYFNFNYIVSILFILLTTLLFIRKKVFSSDLWTQPLRLYQNIKEFAHYSHPILLFSIVGVGIAMFDIWLLQRTGGSEQTGFYTLAYSIAAVSFLFTSSMTPIITREFSRSFERGDNEKIRTHFKRYIPMFYSIAAFFAVFTAFQSDHLIQIFTDEKFALAAPALVVIALYPIHQTYGQLSGSLFFASGNTSRYRNIGLVTSLVGLIFTFVFLFVLELGALGLAWKMLLTQLVGVTIQLYFNTSFLKLKMTPFILHQLYSFLFFLFSAFVSFQLVSSIQTPLVNLLLCAFFYTLFTIIGGVIFPQIFATTRGEIKALFSRKSKDALIDA
ncbi:MAG TPA: lipopolysaccharide biosynthesis protein [Sulfuricurvum sp.]|nr:lipopolysaccharide biosynthesis protein [Sulfuricurvum sp.]